MEPEEVGQEAQGGGVLGWIVGTIVVCAAFWGVLYFASLQQLREELSRYQEAQAELEAEMPTPEAERALARVKRELAELSQRWEATTAAAINQKVKPHGVDVLRARPGQEAGKFVLEVEGSGHALGEALPELQEEPGGRRLPAVLYFRRVERHEVPRGTFTLEGAGRIREWTVEPAATEE